MGAVTKRTCRRRAAVPPEESLLSVLLIVGTSGGRADEISPCLELSRATWRSADLTHVVANVPVGARRRLRLAAAAAQGRVRRVRWLAACGADARAASALLHACEANAAGVVRELLLLFPTLHSADELMFCLGKAVAKDSVTAVHAMLENAAVRDGLRSDRHADVAVTAVGARRPLCLHALLPHVGHVTAATFEAAMTRQPCPERTAALSTLLDACPKLPAPLLMRLFAWATTVFPAATCTTGLVSRLLARGAFHRFDLAEAAARCSDLSILDCILAVPGFDVRTAEVLGRPVLDIACSWEGRRNDIVCGLLDAGAPATLEALLATTSLLDRGSAPLSEAALSILLRLTPDPWTAQVVPPELTAVARCYPRVIAAALEERIRTCRIRERGGDATATALLGGERELLSPLLAGGYDELLEALCDAPGFPTSIGPFEDAALVLLRRGAAPTPHALLHAARTGMRRAVAVMVRGHGDALGRRLRIGVDTAVAKLTSEAQFLHCDRLMDLCPPGATALDVACALGVADMALLLLRDLGARPTCFSICAAAARSAASASCWAASALPDRPGCEVPGAHWAVVFVALLDHWGGVTVAEDVDGGTLERCIGSPGFQCLQVSESSMSLLEMACCIPGAAAESVVLPLLARGARPTLRAAAAAVALLGDAATPVLRAFFAADPTAASVSVPHNFLLFLSARYASFQWDAVSLCSDDDNDNRTLLDVAVAAHNAGAVAELLDLGARPGASALKIAACRADAATVDVLLSDPRCMPHVAGVDGLFEDVLSRRTPGISSDNILRTVHALLRGGVRPNVAELVKAVQTKHVAALVDMLACLLRDDSPVSSAFFNACATANLSLQVVSSLLSLPPKRAPAPDADSVALLAELGPLPTYRMLWCGLSAVVSTAACLGDWFITAALERRRAEGCEPLAAEDAVEAAAGRATLLELVCWTTAARHHDPEAPERAMAALVDAGALVTPRALIDLDGARHPTEHYTTCSSGLRSLVGRPYYALASPEGPVLPPGASSSVLDASVSEAQRQEHDTPLTWYAHRGDVGAVRVLLEAGASRDILDGLGRTALEIAKANHWTELVEALGGGSESEDADIDVAGRERSASQESGGSWETFNYPHDDEPPTPPGGLVDGLAEWQEAMRGRPEPSAEDIIAVEWPPRRVLEPVAQSESAPGLPVGLQVWAVPRA